MWFQTSSRKQPYVCGRIFKIRLCKLLLNISQDLDKARQLGEKTSAIKRPLTLMEQLRGNAKAIDQQELEIAKLQDEVNTLESTPAITKEAIEALTMVRKSMEAAKEEFKNFKWKL
ncbi:hypothetical protein E6C27_scaffold1244G00060 [Cucumis melo var. makuwa]|uniref:Uncharacterized protein n=1 Tax=Cucumis melo var. makuwa TaxID=1194695 RepID=A0A5A7SZX1_CUCMM|nr:hypothetical protein E6C27_scaffold1244G00060 [Cucumis melo var. makuwa]